MHCLIWCGAPYCNTGRCSGPAAARKGARSCALKFKNKHQMRWSMGRAHPPKYRPPQSREPTAQSFTGRTGRGAADHPLTAVHPSFAHTPHRRTQLPRSVARDRQVTDNTDNTHTEPKLYALTCAPLSVLLSSGLSSSAQFKLLRMCVCASLPTRSPSGGKWVYWLNWWRKGKKEKVPPLFGSFLPRPLSPSLSAQRQP